jgi:hypothetical protein
MQYIKYTYDTRDGNPNTPDVVGLQFVWARESQYPTTSPEFFGTAHIGSSVDVPGVLAVLSRAEWGRLRDEEIAAREPYRRFSSSQYLALFTLDERRAIRLASVENVDVGLLYDEAIAADYITWLDPRTAAGLHALMLNGLLTQERLDEISEALQA